MLELNNVALNYFSKNGETSALKNITFKVNQGELVSIVGPSGCGKTTILSLISGLIKPSKGTVKINGEQVNSNLCGYMFQKDHLFEWRTIWQNIILGLEIQKKHKDEKTLCFAEELLKKYDLYNFKNKKPRQLSGGMRQRVALIRTLVLNPTLLLLDEPFSALDFQTRLKVCDDVYQIIKSEEKTALLVTHDISEALSMSDQIIILSSRPASVKKELKINFQGKTPLEKREDKDFGKYFELIWRNLS